MSTPPASSEKSLRVLLVEGDRARRDELRLVLEGNAMIVLCCTAATAALDSAQNFQPDLIMIGEAENKDDILVRQMRERDGFAAVPIVLLSGDTDPIARFKAIAEGADEVLVNPVPPALLLAAVRGRIGRARMLVPKLPEAPDHERRAGPLRRGEFLAQLGIVLRGNPGPWQVLMAVRVDQATPELGEMLGQAGAFELEQAIAARFSAALSGDDAHTLWMEFGFGVLAARESREEIEELALELCRRVAEAPFHTRGKDHVLTVSVGVALAPGGPDEGNPDRWFASAYAVQALAHRHGGNCYDGVLSRNHGALPPERVMIIREWAKLASTGENVVIEFQPVLPLRTGLAGLYSLDAKLRDFRAPLAGVTRSEYVNLAREAGSLPMIDRMSLFSAFEAIEEEREHGRTTRVLVRMDLASIHDKHLQWLDAELRRRKAHSDGLVIEFDADVALGQLELSRVVQRLEDQGVMIAISDMSGSLTRIRELQRFPANMLRLPVSAIDSVPPPVFIEMLAPWQASGRGIIADAVGDAAIVGRLLELQIGYAQGDALAASAPRLDYDFSQFGG